ncbi:MAG: PASTA domain-containing protein [Acidobacteriota bacterium]
MRFLWAVVRFFGRLILAVVKLAILCVLLAVTGAASWWITMRYLIVGEEVVVPNVVNLSLTQAEELARASHLTVLAKTSRYDEKAKENVVLEQEPAEGIRIKANKRIYVVLSKGSRRMMVPDLAGLNTPQAQVRLSEDGLELGALVMAKSARVVEGGVLAQEPPAGAEYFKGSSVSLLVSAGPEEAAFVMPDLIGRNVDDVVKFMQDAGLRLGDIKDEEYEGLEAGTITQQSPKAGSRVGTRNIITLTVVAEPQGSVPGIPDEPPQEP